MDLPTAYKHLYTYIYIRREREREIHVDINSWKTLLQLEISPVVASHTHSEVHGTQQLLPAGLQAPVAIGVTHKNPLRETIYHIISFWAAAKPES